MNSELIREQIDILLDAIKNEKIPNEYINAIRLSKGILEEKLNSIRNTDYFAHIPTSDNW